MQKKTVVRSPLVPETGGPFNLAVSYNGLIYVSGLPPFEEAFCAQLRQARKQGTPMPAMPQIPFEDQVHIVMRHLKLLLEAGGSNMNCLLKVVVWLQDQDKMRGFDTIYRSYFDASDDALPTRTRMQAGRTPFDCALEIDAIGFIPDAR